jgi:Kef-type K+ transport system membrane component KefB
MNELAITLVQIILIVLSGRLLGLLLRHFRQPGVIGEIAAGILLGPSAFGRLAPKTFALVFRPESIPTLLALSQIGLILFMFLVGLEFSPELMREKRKNIVVISHVSIIVPFLLGTALALYLFPLVSSPGVPFRNFALFLGISMSITAFPVLARILEERNLLRTRMGNTVIACAAVDDITAWCILAVVIMIVRVEDPAHLAVRLALLVTYVIAMIAGVRPLLRRWLNKTMLAAALLLVLASSGITELLGIHALFGAFLAGTIMPRTGGVTEGLIAQIRGVTSVIFLPLFFAVTGLRTNVGLLHSPALWMCCALVLAVAIVGKLGGAMVSAAALGFSWRESAAIGVLMNTRGLMEMVVLNIGLDIGVISHSLFTMIVIMALITTAMTTPIIDRIVPQAQEVVSHDAVDAVA